MPYSPEQLSDRAEILDVVHRYAWSIDTRDWDALDTCFSEDAYVDYSSNPGGTEGPYREVRGWLEHNLAAFVVMQHLMVEHRHHARRRSGDRAHDDGEPDGCAHA